MPTAKTLPVSKTRLRRAVHRELARRRMENFVKYTFHQYRTEPAHALIAAHLDRVVAGEIRRLMIFAPPQHGKSQLFSIHLPAFWLGRRPDEPVISASYAASLAARNSRQARAIFESQEFAELFPDIARAGNVRQVEHWSLGAPYQGFLRGTGVGGSLTGHGARLGIIDDPHKSWEDAQSQYVQVTAWEWWQGTFRTRIWEDGAIVLGATRWHPTDLPGRILQAQAEKWTVLRLPAVAESQEERDAHNEYMGLPTGQPDPLGRAEGEPLCPQRFSREALAEIKEDVGTMVWAAEYQQVPRPREGTWIKRWMLPITREAPVEAERVRYWDKAGTLGGGAATAGVLMARTREGLIYIEDVQRGFWSTHQREEIIKQTAELDAQRYKHGVKIYIEQEPGSGGKESAEATIQNLTGFSVYADRPSGDKNTRMEPFIAQAEAGNVQMVAGRWNHDYIEELIAIPNGAYRDQADATAGALSKLRKPSRSARSHVSVSADNARRMFGG